MRSDGAGERGQAFEGILGQPVNAKKDGKTNRAHCQQRVEADFAKMRRAVVMLVRTENDVRHNQ